MPSRLNQSSNNRCTQKNIKKTKKKKTNRPAAAARAAATAGARSAGPATTAARSTTTAGLCSAGAFAPAGASLAATAGMAGRRRLAGAHQLAAIGANWASDHRTWAQRGGYGGYYIPQDSYNRSFRQPALLPPRLAAGYVSGLSAFRVRRLFVPDGGSIAGILGHELVCVGRCLHRLRRWLLSAHRGIRK